MQETTIKTDKIYLSEVMSTLPSGILLNKGVTGCGGTYVELNSKRNSIILVPTIELANNKAKPEYLIVHGEVSEKTITNYLKSEIKYKKIIGTYDCLKRLLKFDVLDYFLLIDEYHILFNAYSFRNSAVLYILENYSKFNEYCFMTATPLDNDIILEQIKNLPRLNIVWSNAVNVKLKIINVNFTNKELIKLLLSNEDVNYHIFLNSVKTIKEIVTKTKMIDYKIVCSKAAKSNNTTLKMGTTLDKVCKFNFYTSTAFEGCDVYDPKGKTIILSDTNIASTMLDISTLIRQICGRLRDSIYKDEATLILNTSKHRYGGITPKMFALQVKDNAYLGKLKSERFQTDTEDFKKAELRTYTYEGFSSIYLNKYENNIFFDLNLQKRDEYNFKLVHSIYNSLISVIKEVQKNQLIPEVVKRTTSTNWVTSKLEKMEYSLEELTQLFQEDFKKLGIPLNGYTIKDHFPPFEKIRKTKNGNKLTYYRFQLNE